VAKNNQNEALAKGLGPHFTKAAEHHMSMHKAHSEHSAFLKGMHEGLSDEDLHKAAYGKGADHHAALAALHKAHAEHLQQIAQDSDDDGKAALAGGLAKTETTLDNKPAEETVPPTDVPVPNMGAFMAKSIGEAMESMGKTDDFKKLITNYVMEAAKEALGKQIVPTTVKAVGTLGDPEKQVNKIVLRPGQELPELPELDKAEMPSELVGF
jgi:hypothetical protein